MAKSTSERPRNVLGIEGIARGKRCRMTVPANTDNKPLGLLLPIGDISAVECEDNYYRQIEPAQAA